MAAYNGTDLLEIMEEAKNYNALIEQIVHTHLTGRRIMDFGAGQGQFALPLQKRGWEVHCVEADPHLANILERKSLKIHTSIPSNTLFDSIYSINVLEHIENDQQMAQKLVDQLQPGGRMVVYVPAFMILFSPLDRKIGHHRRYTKKTLKNLFPGLNIIKCHYVDSIGFFASLYLKFVGNQDGQISPEMVRFYDRWLFPISCALDWLCHPLFGKNVFLVGEKKI